MNETGCWADPLTTRERYELRKRLERACKKSYGARLGLARPGSFDLAFDVVAVSAEMGDLHLDVTERAEVAPDHPSRQRFGTPSCRWHGDVDDDHFPCRAPGETAGQFTARMLGETRDV